MRKEKLIWTPKFLLSRKESRKFWKRLSKAKSKESLQDGLLEIAWNMQELETRLIELKKFVGNKNKY